MEPQSQSRLLDEQGKESWDYVIRPHESLLQIHLGELWRYRELIGMLVHRDYASMYRQTILGSFWNILQPLLQTGFFLIVFNQIARIPTDAVPPVLFYMSGVLCWRYFSDCVGKTASTFSNHSGIFDKVYFPRLVMPLSQALVSLISFGIQFVLFLAVYFFLLFKGAKIHPDWRIVVLPVLIVEMAVLGLGVGCLISAMTARYRDLGVPVGFLLQLWMYASCVVFPLSNVPANWRWLVSLNPMVPIIEAFRYAFFGSGTVHVLQILIGMLLAVIIFGFGVVVFNKVARVSADTV